MASNGEYELITKHIRNILYNKAIYHVYTQCTSRWFKSHFSPMGYKLYIARHVTHVCTHETWKRKMAQNTLYSSVLWFHLVSKFGGYYLRLYAGKKWNDKHQSQPTSAKSLSSPSPGMTHIIQTRRKFIQPGIIRYTGAYKYSKTELRYKWTWCSFRMIRLTPPPIWFY